MKASGGPSDLNDFGSKGEKGAFAVNTKWIDERCKTMGKTIQADVISVIVLM